MHLLRKRGYREVWRNAKLTMHNLDQFEPPDYRAAPLTGNYGTEASHLLALNHREAAGYRWGYIWRPVLDPDGSDFPTDISFWGSRIDLPDDKGGICLVTVGRLRDWDYRRGGYLGSSGIGRRCIEHASNARDCGGASEKHEGAPSHRLCSRTPCG